MPKYYCDYCDIFLTHDSPSVRKAHNTGWKHINQVASYYRELDKDKTQDVIDNITKAYDGQVPLPQLAPVNLEYLAMTSGQQMYNNNSSARQGGYSGPRRGSGNNSNSGNRRGGGGYRGGSRSSPYGRQGFGGQSHYARHERRQAPAFAEDRAPVRQSSPRSSHQGPALSAPPQTWGSARDL